MTTTFSSVTEVVHFLANTSSRIRRSQNGKLFLCPRNKDQIADDCSQNLLLFFESFSDEQLATVNDDIKQQHSILHPYTPINQWQECSRPREIMKNIGSENMSNDQLLTILISIGRPGVSAQTIAQNLLNQHHTLRGIAQLSIKELCKTPGIGLAKASQIVAALEIGKRLGQERTEKNFKLKQPEHVLSFVSDQIGLSLQDSKKEYLYVILMDNKMKPIYLFKSSVGSVDTNVVDIQEIIRKVSEHGATSLILVHNHPSGETLPSLEDEETTRRVSKACHLLGVKLIDHVIVGTNPEDYFSFQKKGLL